MANAFILNKLIEHLGISISEFERKIGSGASTINKAIQRNSALKEDVVDKIVRAYPSVNRDWLLTGTGNMIQPILGEPKVHYGGSKTESREFNPPMPTGEWLLSRLAGDYKLDYTESVELRIISDFAARLVIEGNMDIGDRKSHIAMLLDYANIYIQQKHH